MILFTPRPQKKKKVSNIPFDYLSTYQSVYNMINSVQSTMIVAKDKTEASKVENGSVNAAEPPKYKCKRQRLRKHLYFINQL